MAESAFSNLLAAEYKKKTIFNEVKAMLK